MKKTKFLCGALIATMALSAFTGCNNREAQLQSDYEAVMDFISEGQEAYESMNADAVGDHITSSRVTSANSTAHMIKNNIDVFLVNADVERYGMKMGNSIVQECDITIYDYKWEVSAFTPSNFKEGSSMSFGTVGYGSADMSKDGVSSAETLLAIELAKMFPDIKSGSAHVVMCGGKTTGVAYTDNKNTPLNVGTDCPGIVVDANGVTKFAETFSWDGKTQGVTSGGLIVGTAPMVDLG